MDKQLIKDWLAVKEQLESLQKQERELRTVIARYVLDGKKEGSKTDVVEGIKLSATAVVSYKLDQAELSLIFDSLSEAEKACIKYKPELSLKSYRKLKDDCELNKVITTHEGMPQLKVV